MPRTIEEQLQISDEFVHKYLEDAENLATWILIHSKNDPHIRNSGIWDIVKRHVSWKYAELL